MSIVAVILMKERRLVESLRSAGVTTPEAARPLGDLPDRDGLAMRRLLRRAVVREASNGAYYLDEASWSSVRRMRRRVVGVVIGAALLLVAALYFGLVH